MRWPFLILLGLSLVVSAQLQGQHLKAAAGDTQKFKDCAQCPEMVVVPAGSFMMGSPQDEPKRANEREDQVTAHRIQLNPLRPQKSGRPSLDLGAAWTWGQPADENERGIGWLSQQRHRLD